MCDDDRVVADRSPSGLGRTIQHHPHQTTVGTELGLRDTAMHRQACPSLLWQFYLTVLDFRAVGE